MIAKPLHWTRYESGASCGATRLRADYWVRPRGERWAAVAHFFMDESLHDNEQQAMDACQQHFEAELAAMIEG